jgi:hypothetical protein
MNTAIASLAVLVGGLASSTIPPAPPSPDLAKGKALVQKLGSLKFRERDEAANELLRMGRAAKVPLLEGMKSSDPEIQNRCEQLLPQALSLDLLFRIDQFNKDPEGKQKHDLPCWKLFQEKVGTDAAARQLFTEMLKANASLLEIVEDRPEKATDAITSRYQEMYQELFGGQQQFGGGFRNTSRDEILNGAEVACVLFAASTPAYKPNQPDWILSNLYSQPPFTKYWKDAKVGPAYRKVFVNYLDSRMDDMMINNNVWIVCQNNMRETADVFAKALKNGKAQQPYSKASAICCIGTLGSKSHLSVIEPYFTDKTVVQQGFIGPGGTGEVQMRDIALAVVIHLNGRNPKDFGFTQWQSYPNQMIPYHQLGFVDDKDRDAAIKKWKEEANKVTPKVEPKKDAPKPPMPVQNNAPAPK